MAPPITLPPLRNNTPSLWANVAAIREILINAGIAVEATHFDEAAAADTPPSEDS